MSVEADLAKILSKAELDPCQSILLGSEEAYRAGVSNEHINRLCRVDFTNGILVGGVSGAGGGFLMFVVPPENRRGLITALGESLKKSLPIGAAKRGKRGGKRMAAGEIPLILRWLISVLRVLRRRPGWEA